MPSDPVAAGVRILPEHTINQIAAGEVVERPASVVKELVENSLDAGARVLAVHLRDGGRERIRVVDDGRGMGRQDALMCIERHATSKIRAAADLQHVRTLGFRGEALPSIAAVSRFELRTRPHDADEGTRVRVDSGRLTDVREMGCAPGTEIDVRSLFANLPARRAFLRTRATELGHCVEAVTRQALIRPDVDVTLRHGERQLLRAPATDDPAQRAADLLGRDARRLVRVDGAQGEVQVVGLAAPPGVDRPTPNGALYLYVNGRYVRDPVVRRALRQAYRDLVAPGRSPIVVLDVRLPTERVDVNVHPTKSEVRFHDPRGVTTAVAALVREAVLAGAPDPTTAGRAVRGGARVDAGPSLFAVTPPPWTDPLPASAYVAEPPVAPLELPHEPAIQPAPAATRPASAAPQATLRALPLRGVAHRRYVLLEVADGLWVVDGGRLALQVACARPSPPQRLLVPVTCAVPAAHRDAVAQAGEQVLPALGLEILAFSASEWAVKATPSALAEADPAALLLLAAEALAQGRDVAASWASGLAPVDVDPDDLRAVRWMLATADELGVDPMPWVRRVPLDPGV